MSAGKAPKWKKSDRSTVSTMIYCKDALAVVDFARDVFGAELVRKPLLRADGRLFNAEMKIGESTMLVAEGDEHMNAPAFVYVQVPDVDAVYEKALKAGAEPMMPVQDQFYGDRDGGVRDRSGNVWWIGTHQKDMTEEELDAAARDFEAASTSGG